MFKKTTNYLKKTAKSVLSSGRLKTLALMLLVGGGIAMAQNSAGDYTAGTTALTTVTEEIAKYVQLFGQNKRCACVGFVKLLPHTIGAVIVQPFISSKLEFVSL